MFGGALEVWGADSLRAVPFSRNDFMEGFQAGIVS